MPEKSITILICTHNRANLLLKTLNHLNAAKLPENYLVRIFVMLNACCDNSKRCLQEFITANPGGLKIDWNEEPKPGKSYALNSAIELITSELIAFVDDDQRVDEDYLVNVCKIAQQYPETGIFCGRIIPDWNGSEPSWIHDTGPYKIYPLPIPIQDWGDISRSLSRGDKLPGGGNIIARRRLFKRIGNFSTRLGPQGHNLTGGEDTELILRALNNNEKLVYTPNIVQYHYVDNDRFRLIYLLRKSFSRSRTTMHIKNTGHAYPPLYMWRKLAGYSFKALFSINWRKTRFYLVRTAAALGEIMGTLSSTQK